MWKILKGRSFVKAQIRLKLGGGHDLFYPGETKIVEQEGYRNAVLEK
jgi:hypothetical protein